jgi:adenine-specific DNA-methyltransferase
MILLGNCLDELKKLNDCSVDAVVTDPPYGLNFMGKKWDYDVPNTDIWCEVLRVLKPGGHLLSFFGTRTYHRGVVRIEDSGFKIRDQIQWIYGSGFPKSLNLKDEWKGWGTALKPANEPIVLARKPLSEKTVADNVLKWGCGAINVDGSRIENLGKRGNPCGADGKIHRTTGNCYGTHNQNESFDLTQGRWPTNIIFDEAAVEMLGEPSRFFYVAKASQKERGKDNNHPTVKPIKLMEYLIKLITPPNGIVLDPFMGSGSTGVAANNLGFNFIGIELNEEYFEIAKERLNNNLKLI